MAELWQNSRHAKTITARIAGIVVLPTWSLLTIDRTSIASEVALGVPAGDSLILKEKREEQASWSHGLAPTKTSIVGNFMHGGFSGNSQQGGKNRFRGVPNTTGSAV
jgi:hypothetical protein